MVGVLDGLRVLDLSNLFAAPQVAAILGDFGAEVVKVEPPSGDPLRSMGASTSRRRREAMWAVVNRNKRSVTLAVDTPDGQRVLRDLLARVDVVVENLPEATRRRWGCTFEELTAVNPELVVVSVSCYGRSGPYADRPGAGTLAEAFAGLTHLTGEADGPPMLTSVPIGDTLAGWFGAFGAVLACYHRARGGGGQHVDVSMYEPVLSLLSSALAGYEPGQLPPRRSGSRVGGGVPRNVYRTSDDRFVAVSGTTDNQVARLLVLLGADTLANRARFGASADRLSAADELDSMVAEWVGTRRRDDVLSALLDARIPAAPVNDLADVWADPQVRARASIVDLDDVLVVRPAPFLSATPGAVRTLGPGLGADNEAVYCGWLGMGQTELERLHDAGVV